VKWGGEKPTLVCGGQEGPKNGDRVVGVIKNWPRHKTSTQKRGLELRGKLVGQSNHGVNMQSSGSSGARTKSASASLQRGRSNPGGGEHV